MIAEFSLGIRVLLVLGWGALAAVTLLFVLIARDIRRHRRLQAEAAERDRAAKAKRAPRRFQFPQVDPGRE